MHSLTPRIFLFAAMAPLATGAVPAPAADPVKAHWRPIEINFTYTGFTTAYACEALDDKIEDILEVLGAHPNTTVSASGCPFNRPSRTAFVRIVTAVPATEAGDGERSRNRGDRDELVQTLKLGTKDTFTAVRRTIRLSQDRQLDLAPGDCELMAELRDQVLPPLGIEVLEENVTCVPHQVGITTPTLRVSALIPAEASVSAE